ncbi:vacuolar fusion protein MON1 [Kwoniella heveanensis CBS 569]|nr:vacuolar fusion protein MON1 [Kwoniella heveanensis CBS 569]
MLHCADEIDNFDMDRGLLRAETDHPFKPRRYYVLTHAGKPVFSSHDNSSEDNITNIMGIAQALISIFAEQDDKIRCIVKGRSKIAFLLKAPLYLFCVSDWSEPEHVLRSHLEYIHLHILSVVSSTQLSRVFQRRSNFDLSRLLEGTETFLNKLIDRAQYDFSYLTSTLQPLRMNPAVRENAAAALMPPSKFKDLLYVLLIAGGHIVTLLRPRKHSIHPSDLHLLLNTLASSPTLRASETWLPICFPKFNPAGFVHAYISYVVDDVGLVFVSADREAFEELRGWKEIVLAKLEQDKTLGKITEAIPSHPYPISAIGCPGLRHFIYKSRIHVQITQPEWETPYTEDSVDRKRLITLYQKLHDSVHARSGQSAPLKLVYLKTEHEACLAWLTKPFELYLTVSPQLSKSAVVAAANAVAKWVLAEEGRVFLKDAPVF